MDQTQSAQQTGTSPQATTSSLQPTGGLEQQSATSVQSSAGVYSGSQESLLDSQLRVGDSQTVVGVSGSASAPTMYKPQDGVSLAWLVLLIPIVIIIVIFWPWRDKDLPNQITSEADTPEEPTPKIKHNPAQQHKKKRNRNKRSR